MDIWSGNLTLPDGATVAGIHLATSHLATTRPAAALALPPSPLRFLALVDPARVPLFLAAGPSLDVWTADESTVDWFSALLLQDGRAVTHDEDEDARLWWEGDTACVQSPVGILAQVEHETHPLSAIRVTELLFYATVESSQLRLHALPLSSELWSRLPTPPLSPQPQDDATAQATEPQFLPPIFSAEDEPTATELRKRQSVTSLFDEAAQRRKRARRAGGESIAAAASRAALPAAAPLPFPHRRSGSLGTAHVNGTAPELADQAAAGAAKLARPLSRSPSLGAEFQPLRPLSRKGVLEAQGAGVGKRSSLSRVATSAATADEEGSVPAQPADQSLESRNKDTISRLVLAGMRMHGLQQRRKDRARKNSVANVDHTIQEPGELSKEQTQAEAARDEEYKLVYHQTYKGAMFALRKHMGTVPLHAHVHALRETVDRLLGIFLGDPLGGGVGAGGTSSVDGLGGSRAGVGACIGGLDGTTDTPSTAMATPGQGKETKKAFGFDANEDIDEGSPFGEREGERRREMTPSTVHTPVVRRVRGRG